MSFIIIVLLICSKKYNGFISERETILLDAEIVKSDLQNNEVSIEYIFNNQTYLSSYNCNVYATAGEMPPVGLKVQIAIVPTEPEIITHMFLMREMGRGFGGRQNYINNTSKKNKTAWSFIIISLFIAGLYMILNGLSII